MYESKVVFLVEGKSEVTFVERFLIPYLYKSKPDLQRIAIRAQTVLSNRRMHKKGGVIGYQYVKNDLDILLKKDNKLVTTLFDFYKLPTDFPNHTTDVSIIHQIEAGMARDYPTLAFIPYLQSYEFEALMFANLEGFELFIEDEQQREELAHIQASFPNPETINNNAPPSKRLQRILNYKKVTDTEIILEEVSIQDMRQTCPRFNVWIEKLLSFEFY